MIRVLLFVILAALFLFITLPVLGVVWLLQRRWPGLGNRFLCRLLGFGTRLVMLPSGIRVTVRGRENIPTDRPVLFIGNHRSYLDVILGYPLLPPVTGYVAKQGLAKLPIVPIWMRMLHCQFLVKDDLKQNLKAILSAIDSVKSGASIFIYPEGQRGTGEDERELLEFHEGSFKIATKTGCPIVPVAVCGTRECWEAQFPRLKKGRVIFEFGQPIETASLSREELKGIGARTREVVQEMVVRNHDELTSR